MQLFFIGFISFTLLSATTWQNIQSSTNTQTVLNVQPGSLERSVVEFNIDGFHLIPIQMPSGEMYLAHLEDGASSNLFLLCKKSGLKDHFNYGLSLRCVHNPLDIPPYELIVT